MAGSRTTSAFWIKALLTAGALLALALLAQTVLNYRYVASSLIRQEARRTAEERVRNVERAARLAQPQNAESFRGDSRGSAWEMSDQIASIALLQGDGAVMAASGLPSRCSGSSERARLVMDQPRADRARSGGRPRNPDRRVPMSVWRPTTRVWFRRSARPPVPGDRHLSRQPLGAVCATETQRGDQRLGGAGIVLSVSSIGSASARTCGASSSKSR